VVAIILLVVVTFIVGVPLAYIVVGKHAEVAPNSGVGSREGGERGGAPFNQPKSTAKRNPLFHLSVT
jgi:hypothetical protein